jgi:hypothetical protein
MCYSGLTLKNYIPASRDGHNCSDDITGRLCKYLNSKGKVQSKSQNFILT